jgi:chaperonin GroEL (HSP60 family)
MPDKQWFFRAEAREKIVRGASALADAVRVTLGPKSKCALISRNVAAGASVIDVKRGIDARVQAAIEAIRSISMARGKQERTCLSRYDFIKQIRTCRE